MPNTLLSRNPFADPKLATFAGLIARVGADPTLELRVRQNWVWALKTVSRAIGKDPMAIPAHPEFLRKAMAKAAPDAIGIGRPSWNNARSLTGKVLEWAGLALIPGHYQAPLTPQWDILWATLPPGKNALRMQLSRFFHFCSARAISPDQVCDDVIITFHEALITESIVELPYELYRGTAKSWNNAVERVRGWPQQRLTVPSRQQIFCLPWSAFPPSLEADVQAYLRRAEGLNLDDYHFTRAQRPSTLETRGWQLQLLATAIVKGGIAADILVDLRTILVPEIAARGLQYLVDRNGGKSCVQTSNVALFLPTLARGSTSTRVSSLGYGRSPESYGSPSVE